MTQPGRQADKFLESKTLKDMRRGAQVCSPGPERRHAWKAVQARHRLELKEWHTKLNGKRDWRAYRAQKQLARTREWEHYLLDDENWQSALKLHFEGIFHKEDPTLVAQQMRGMKLELAYLCKTHAWHPFNLTELKVTQGRWPKRKAAGPDSIIHEALSFLLQDDKWAHRNLYILNDAFIGATCSWSYAVHSTSSTPFASYNGVQEDDSLSRCCWRSAKSRECQESGEDPFT